MFSMFIVNDRVSKLNEDECSTEIKVVNVCVDFIVDYTKTCDESTLCGVICILYIFTFCTQVTKVTCNYRTKTCKF